MLGGLLVERSFSPTGAAGRLRASERGGWGLGAWGLGGVG
jgi:hypothetical protein